MRLARGLIVFLLLSGQGALLYSSLSRESANYDETEYLYSGYRTWAVGDLSINPHPPLVKMLAGLGVYPLRPALVPDRDPGKVRTAWPESQQFLYRGSTDARRILIAARLPMLLLWALLGLVIYLWSTELYGAKAGFFSLGLFLLSPTAAASGRLVSTDLGLAACGLLALYCYFLARRKPTRWRFVLAGVTLGLALGCRHQALVIAGLMPIFALWLGGSEPAARRRALRGSALQLGIAVAVLAALYGLVKLPYYYQGFSLLLNDLRGDTHQPYILGGEISLDGWYHYFPLLIWFKLSPVHLLVMAVTLGSLVKLRPRPEEWIALLPMLLLFALAVVSRVNYGIRHILIVLPPCWILAGRLIPLTKGRPLATAALALALIGGGIEMSRIHPHYLAYINPLAGGPSAGYRLLADGNLDAGQDLGNLGRRIREKRYGEVYLCYFGTADPIYYKIPYRYLPGYWNERLLTEETAEARFPRYLAVSATYLQLYRTGAYHWLLQYEPIDQVGYSIMIYDRAQHPEWLAYLAGLYTEAGYAQLARTHLTELQRIAPEKLALAWDWQVRRFAQDPKSWLNYGVALQHAEFDAAAQRVFDSLKQTDGPTGRMARNNLGILLSRQARRLFASGSYARAAALYQQAFLETADQTHRDDRFRSLAAGGMMEAARSAFTADRELTQRYRKLARYLRALEKPR